MTVYICFKYKTTKVLDYFPGCPTLGVAETSSVVDFHWPSYWWKLKLKHERWMFLQKYNFLERETWTFDFYRARACQKILVVSPAAALFAIEAAARQNCLNMLSTGGLKLPFAAFPPMNCSFWWTEDSYGRLSGQFLSEEHRFLAVFAQAFLALWLVIRLSVPRPAAFAQSFIKVFSFLPPIGWSLNHFALDKANFSLPSEDCLSLGRMATHRREFPLAV